MLTVARLPVPNTADMILDVARVWMHPQWVNIDTKKLVSLVLPADLPDLVQEESWVYEDSVHPILQQSTMDQVMRLLAFASIHHGLWDKHNGSVVEYSHAGYQGSKALALAFKTAWEHPQSPLRKAVVSKIPLSSYDIQKMFGALSFPADRARMLNEVVLSNEWRPLAAQAYHLALVNVPLDVGFASQLALLFPSGFMDPLLRKAQWTSYAISRAIQAVHPLSFEGVGMADHILCASLVDLGVLVLSEPLKRMLASQEILPDHGPALRALRASAVLAMDHLSRFHQKPTSSLEAWCRAQRHTTPLYRSLGNVC